MLPSGWRDGERVNVARRAAVPGMKPMAAGQDRIRQAGRNMATSADSIDRLERITGHTGGHMRDHPDWSYGAILMGV